MAFTWNNGGDRQCRRCDELVPFGKAVVVEVSQNFPRGKLAGFSKSLAIHFLHQGIPETSSGKADSLS
jgi:hypothetical protein